MTTARPFDDADWQAFAGAEPWPNGDQPLAREVGRFLVIADCVEVQAMRLRPEEMNQPDEDRYWSLTYGFPTQKGALAFLNGLPEDIEPEAFGFVAH
jgi:hypothetical protein